MDTKIAIFNPENQLAVASDVAGVCKAIVTATAQSIKGKKYVRVEGWQAIATAHGCMASARNVEAIEGGIRCIGEIRRLDTNAVICTAEGFVGDDEPTWENRPLFARRAMCQTRAISRVCRSAFAHVVVMMNAGLETTPSEEIIDADYRPHRRPGVKEMIEEITFERLMEKVDSIGLDRSRLAAWCMRKWDVELIDLTQTQIKELIKRLPSFAAKQKESEENINVAPEVLSHGEELVL